MINHQSSSPPPTIINKQERFQHETSLSSRSQAYLFLMSEKDENMQQGRWERKIVKNLLRKNVFCEPKNKIIVKDEFWVARAFLEGFSFATTRSWQEKHQTRRNTFFETPWVDKRTCLFSQIHYQINFSLQITSESENNKVKDILRFLFTRWFNFFLISTIKLSLLLQFHWMKLHDWIAWLSDLACRLRTLWNSTRFH